MVPIVSQRAKGKGAIETHKSCANGPNEVGPRYVACRYRGPLLETAGVARIAYLALVWHLSRRLRPGCPTRSILDLIMLGSFLACFLVLIAGRLSWQYVTSRLRRRGVPLPPGPRGLPLVGNVLDFPQKEEWLGYDALTKQYGALSFESCLSDSDVELPPG
jgi:hypothetical protein